MTLSEALRLTWPIFVLPFLVWGAILGLVWAGYAWVALGVIGALFVVAGLCIGDNGDWECGQ